MKKLLCMALFAGCLTANAQTNTFPTTGNAGIGTLTPSEELEVIGTTMTDKLIVKGISGSFLVTQMGPIVSGNSRQINFMLNSASNDQVRTNMYNSVGSIKYDLYFDSTQSYMKFNGYDNTEAFKFSSTSLYGNFMHMPKTNSRIVIGDFGTYLLSDGHKFVVKDGSAMIEGNILTNSNVGIGTSLFVDGNDTYKLSVNGKVRAHSVKVYTGWADYVFEDDYNLPTLEEVENHIKEHGHLKDIPSAKEVEDNGIELGEMNKLLLQKIEELTLYTIELKKEIDELKAKK